MGGEGRITRLHMQPQLHRAAAAGGELIAHLLQLTRHQGEQIGGLGEGIVPHGVMAPIRQIAGFEAVAVGEQHRAARLIRLDAYPEAAEQIGAVGMEGDAAEAHRLALGGEHPATHVEPLQAGVALGVNAHAAAQAERVGRGLMQHQAGGLQRVGTRRQRSAIQCELQQLQLHPLQLQRAGLRRGIGLELKLGLH